MTRRSRHTTRTRKAPPLAVECPHCGWRERELEVHRIDLALADGRTHRIRTNCMRCLKDFTLTVAVHVTIASILPADVAGVPA